MKCHRYVFLFHHFLSKIFTFSTIWHSFRLQELVERKANVYATLEKLQEEVKQITEITEILKDADNIKDSKTFVEEIKKKFGVSSQECAMATAIQLDWLTARHVMRIIVVVVVVFSVQRPLFSTNQTGPKRRIAWASTCTSAVATSNRLRTCISVRW